MKIKKNNKGNGYIIGGKHVNKEKLILEVISTYLHEYPGQSISVILKDNELLVNLQNNNSIEDISKKKIYHK